MIRIAIVLLALLTLSSPGWTQPADPDGDRHMTVARYYAGRGDHSGTIHRLMQVLRQSPSSGHAEEALARLTEAYLGVRIAHEAQNAAAVLARKFPNGRWSAYALDALTAAGLAPIEDEGSWLSRMFR